jgi:hypothetical protein
LFNCLRRRVKMLAKLKRTYPNGWIYYDLTVIIEAAEAAKDTEAVKNDAARLVKTFVVAAAIVDKKTEGQRLGEHFDSWKSEKIGKKSSKKSRHKYLQVLKKNRK